MSRTEYREALGLSTATLAKLGKDQYVSMEVLEKTCRHFNVPLHEVVVFELEENKEI
ncbi:helix-turn-helix domain-containing protein [Paenibacillus durus]|uniref:helix-turn-helix domain-containing protein n=1 Tax=Paenibacillus durus TaxID=44251 RepID=UPI000A86FD55|nr:helix-turn-helix transcriptional regulator [Paenibacillus durus]